MALTIKQEKFCIEYAKTGNAQTAYFNAGYNCKESTANANGCRLLKNPEVKARLAEIAAEAKNNAIADIQEMQEKLTSILRQECTEEVIVVDPGEGATKMEKKPSLKEVINAITTLGRMQGAFVESVSLSGSVGVVIVDDIENGEEASDNT